MGDVADIYDGVHATPDYQDKGIMFLSVENIATLKSQKFISEEAFIRDFKIHPEKGDILMTRIGDIGTPNVVETSEKVAYYVSLALLKLKNIEPYFLNNLIQSPLFKKELKLRTLTSAIPQKINKDEIGKASIYQPSSTVEQQKIGSFFKQIENTITLQQRKLSELLTKYEDPIYTPHNGYERVAIRSFAKGTFHCFVEAGKELEVTKMLRVAADKFILNITLAWEHAVAITDEDDL